MKTLLIVLLFFSILLAGCVEPPIPPVEKSYEDFRTYEHLDDPNGKLVVSENGTRLTFNDVSRSSIAKMRKNITIGPSFDLRFSFKLTRLDFNLFEGSNWAAAWFMTMSITPDVGRAVYDMGSYPRNNSLSFYLEAYSSVSGGTINTQTVINIVRDFRFTWADYSRGRIEQWNMELDTLYNVRLYRHANVVFIDVYNGTRLDWSQSMVNWNVNYNYFFPFQGVGVVQNPDPIVSGYIENVKFL
jgi:hypothetical protein